MQVIEIYIDSNITNPKSLSDILSKNKIVEGDKLVIKRASISDEAFIMSVILVVSIIAMWFAKERKNEYSEKLLDDIFKDKTIADIEEEMLTSYGITIEIEQEQERKLWIENARHRLSKGYGEEEPDYEFIILKEPNPYYGNERS